jgi:FtsZ-binding cell division protein ZapB
MMTICGSKGENVTRERTELRRPNEELQRPRTKWQDDIKMDVTEIGWVRRLDSSGSS